MKWKVVVAIVILVLLLGAAAVAVFGFWLPYRNAESTMVQGQMELQQLPDGKLQLTWPEANRKDRYLLEIREDNGTENPYIYSRAYLADNTLKISAFPEGKVITISVRTVLDYKQLWMEKERVSENELVIRAEFIAPTMQNVQWQADENSKTVTLTYDLGEDEWCRLYW